ncbi:hypothetical protein H0H93_012303, partial [Arthromyces matolae]
SRLPEPSVTKLIPRTSGSDGEASREGTPPDIESTRQTISLILWGLKPKKLLLETLEELAKEIRGLSVAKFSDAEGTIEGIADAMIEAKQIISNWPQEKRHEAIEAIKACEDATTANGRELSFYIHRLEAHQRHWDVEEDLKQLPELLKDFRRRKDAKEVLEQAVEDITHLSLKEQAKIQTQMEATYAEVRKWINGWPNNKVKTGAESLLDTWEMFNDLLEPTERPPSPQRNQPVDHRHGGRGGRGGRSE